jgi:hypothetical protein
MNGLPLHVRNSFPAVLSYRAGIDKKLFDNMIDSFVNGFGPGPYRKCLEANYEKEYHRRLGIFLSTHHEIKRILPNHNAPVFSEFGDPNGYDGHVPSVSYLIKMFIRYVESIRTYLDKEIMKLSGKILKGDQKKMVSFGALSILLTLIK